MAEQPTRFTVPGLIVKSANVGENDRMITVLTKEYGKMIAYVPGAKSIKSKRGAATSPLTYSSLSLERKGERYRVTEAAVNRCFFKMGMSPETLALSQYFCELGMTFVQPGEGAEEFLRLLLNSLHFITEEEKSLPLIKAITEFRAAVISGFMPNLLACDECGKFEDAMMVFDLAEGKLLCSDCGQPGTDGTGLNKTLLSALRHIAFSEFGKLYGFDIPEESAVALSRITERYLSLQTGNHFKTLDFYHSSMGQP